MKALPRARSTPSVRRLALRQDGIIVRLRELAAIGEAEVTEPGEYALLAHAVADAGSTGDVGQTQLTPEANNLHWERSLMPPPIAFPIPT